MDYSYLFQHHLFEIHKLYAYGFIKENNSTLLTYKKEVKEYNVYILIQIQLNTFLDVSVYDNDFHEEYTLYSVGKKTVVKTEVEALVEDIIAKCTKQTKIKEELIAYLEKKYQTIPERPWEKYPENITFKTIDSKKWYAILMQVKYTTLDSTKGDDLVDIINIKLDKEKIKSRIDHVHYFLAYHMNKENWITILLDNTIDLEELYQLIDESYHLVEIKGQEQGQQIWIIPCNPVFYDISVILEKEKKILWKQIGKINVDDIVLIYITHPVYQVKYICKVTQTNLNYHVEDTHVKMNKAFEMKFIYKINHDRINLNYLKENGLSGVRNQRKVSKELYQHILSYQLE